MTVWSIPQIALLWIHNGGSPEAGILGDVVSVALAESGGNDHAIGPAGDYGVWQINRVNFAHFGLTTTNALDPNRNARVAVAMSANGYNWAPWCTAWANPGPNCGHGLLRHIQPGSAAYPHLFDVQGALAAAGLFSGTVTAAPDKPHLDTVTKAWADSQGYQNHGAPTHWNSMNALQQALRKV